MFSIDSEQRCSDWRGTYILELTPACWGYTRKRKENIHRMPEYDKHTLTHIPLDLEVDDSVRPNVILQTSGLFQVMLVLSIEHACLHPVCGTFFIALRELVRTGKGNQI